MSNLNTFSILKNKVKKYKSDYKLENYSQAFTWLCLDTLFNMNVDEIEESITDGSMDGGIDAVYINNNNVHILSFKYTNDFQLTDRNFPEDPIDKIIITMDGICNRRTKEKEVNKALWEKITEIWDLLDKHGLINFKFYLVSNKEKPAKHAKIKFETNLNRYRRVEYYYFDQEDLVSKIFERKFKRVDGQFQFIGKEYFERSDGPLKAILATISASDLIKLVQDPEDSIKINEDVFNENVRVFLKLKNRINEKIYETALSKENFEFFYLNNGITLVCEECSYIPNTFSPPVKIKNFQIVNGGQTTHAIFEAFKKNEDLVNNVLVLIRIYETKKDYKISEKISETTNSQNPVRTRDLHANDRIQKKLEEEFQSLGYFYERKKNQYIEKPIEKRLDNELLAQIYMAFYLGLPSQAKNNKSLVFGDKYDEIFNEDVINAEKMLLPYNLFLPLEREKKLIQNKKRKKETISEKEAFISRAVFHILYTIKLISEKENIDLTKKSELKIAIKKSKKYVTTLVDNEMKERGELYTHDKFFKEIKTNELIKEFVLNEYK